MAARDLCPSYEEETCRRADGVGRMRPAGLCRRLTRSRCPRADGNLYEACWQLHIPAAGSAGSPMGEERDVAGDTPGAAKPAAEPMDEAECLRLISAGGVGRIGYTGRFGPTVVPVNYALHEGTIVFRTGQHSPM